MRRTAVALALAGAWLLAPISVYSDSGLTGLVNSTFPARTEDSELHALAHQRAVEIVDEFNHNGMRPGTSEVLAWNEGYDDPVAQAVAGWLGSPDHYRVLVDPNLTRIGCGSHVEDGVYYAACVMASGGNPTATAEPSTEGAPGTDPDAGLIPDVTPHPATPAPITLPDTATEP